MQHYDDKVLDSSLLRMSSVGFIATAGDPLGRTGAATLGIEVVGLHKIQGQPFQVGEITRTIEEML